jgi:CRISPR/Cas system-associated exonuclease Cas4 (RecB family)
MAVFDTAEANRLLDAAFSTADYVGATNGSFLRLTTVTGTDAAAGTLVTGGSYNHQAMAMSAAASRSCSNSGAVSFAGMPATTVNGVEIYNQPQTVRKAYGALTTPRTTAAGDTLSFAAGSVVASFS